MKYCVVRRLPHALTADAPIGSVPGQSGRVLDLVPFVVLSRDRGRPMTKLRRTLGAIRSVLALRHRWQRLRFAAAVWLQDPSLHPLTSYPPFDVDLCARTFKRNQEMLHWYTRSIGAEAVSFLQPFSGVGTRSVSPADAAGVSHMRRRLTVDGTSELDAMYAFYRRVTAEFRERHDDAFVDLTTIFDQAPLGIYIDQVHCSDIGYEMIARRMSVNILKREGVAVDEKP